MANQGRQRPAIPPANGTASKAKLTGSIRIAGSKKTTTKSGNGKVTMKLKSSKRLKKAPKVVIKVKSGSGKTISKTVRAK